MDRPPTWLERAASRVRRAFYAGADSPNRPVEDLGYRGPSFPIPDEKTQARIAQPDALTGWVAGHAGPNRTRISTYPASNLNPGKIRSILEEADRGVVYNYGDFAYQILWRDGHIYASDRERRAAVSGTDFRIHAANESDLAKGLRDYMEAVVDGIDSFDRAVYSMLSAAMVGWSVLEEMYQPGKVRFRGPVGDYVTLAGMYPRELEWVHPKHFWFDYNDDFPLLDLGPDGKVELEPRKFLYHKANGDGIVATRGWIRPVSWLSFFKSSGIRDLSVFLHLYGIPNVWARIDRAKWQDPEYRATLEQALQDIGKGNPSVLFKDMDVTITPAQAGGGSDSVHAPYIGFMNSEISKVIKGQVLTSEAGMSGNSYALSKTHENTFYGTIKSDAIGAANTIREQGFRAWIELNAIGLSNVFGVGLDELLANRPRCGHAIEEDMTPEAKARVMSIGVNDLGASIAANDFYRHFPFNAPRPGEAVLQGRPVKITADGKTVGSLDAADGVTNPKPEPPPTEGRPE